MKRGVISFALVLLLCALNLYGQSLTSVSGTVTDPSGALVAGATITLTNMATGSQRQDKSDSSGRYSFAQIQPGKYKISATATGFAGVDFSNVELLVNTPATVNIAFEKLGAISEVISVTAEAVQVNTTDASLGNAVSGNVITQLPFEARNVVGLLSLQPGVVFLGEPNPALSTITAAAR